MKQYNKNDNIIDHKKKKFINLCNAHSRELRYTRSLILRIIKENIDMSGEIKETVDLLNRLISLQVKLIPLEHKVIQEKFEWESKIIKKDKKEITEEDLRILNRYIATKLQNDCVEHSISEAK